jgi:hypothetical protein
MKILIDVTPSTDGRLGGSAGLVGEPHVLQFSGLMELVARIEELCKADPAGSDGSTSSSTSPMGRSNQEEDS